MVAQVDEQHAAMVALAMDPAGQADCLADIGGAELGAMMSAIGVHGCACSIAMCGNSRAALHWREAFCQPADSAAKARGDSCESIL